MKLKVLLIMMLFICSTVVVAQEDVKVKPGVTPDSWLWNLERASEWVQERFSKASIERHQEERLAEARAMIEKRNPQAAEKAMERVPERVKDSDVAKEFNEKFALTDETINNVTERINEELSSGIAHKSIVPNADILFILKDYDNEFKYYDVRLEDWKIISVTKVATDKGDYTHQVAMSHGEFYALQNMNRAGLVNQLRKVEPYGGQHKYTAMIQDQVQKNSENKIKRSKQDER